MSEVDIIPELKQIVGAMLFAAKEPVSVEHMQQVFAATAEQYGGITKDFAEVTEELLTAAVADLDQSLRTNATGLHVREVAHGYRLANDTGCGPWLRVLLEKGKASKLSRPALETLAIIAYRQPVVRSEIEAVRGVAVDQIVRNLLDLQLIRVVGRSELPGRPWLFGTTQKFLEHFGIKSLNDLPGTDELRRLEAEQERRKQAGEQLEAPLDDTPQAEETAEPDEPRDILGGESSDRLDGDDDPVSHEASAEETEDETADSSAKQLDGNEAP